MLDINLNGRLKNWKLSKIKNDFLISLRLLAIYMARLFDKQYLLINASTSFYFLALRSFNLILGCPTMTDFQNDGN